MNEDIKAKLGSMLSGIDKETVKKFLENGGMKKINKVLSDNDKKKMASEFMKMDSDELLKKLQGVDLKNTDIDELLKKMK